MVCSKCGTEIPEAEKFCPNCGAEIENETLEPDEATENATETPETDLTPIPNALDAPQQKKMSATKKLIIAVVAVVAVAAIAVAAAPKRQIAQLLAGKNYGKEVLEQVLLYSGDYAINSNAGWSNLDSVSLEAGLNLSLPESYEEDLSMLASFFLPVASDAVVSMLANSGLNISFGADYNTGLTGVDATYSVMNESILTASAVKEGGNTYLSLPELLTENVILSDELTGMTGVTAELQEAAESFKGVGLEPMRPAVEAIAAAMPEHFDFSLRKHVDVSIGGGVTNADAVVFDVTHRNRNEALIEAIDILLADEAALQGLTNLYNYYYADSVSASSIETTRTALETQRADLESALEIATDDAVFQCLIYMNEDNEVTGFGFVGYQNYEELVADFAWEAGRGYELKLTEGEEIVRFYGALSAGDKKYGDMYYSAEGGYTAYDGKLLDFSDLDENGGTVTVLASDLMDTFGITYEMLSYIFGPYAAYSDGLMLTATLNNSKADSHLSVVFRNSDEAEIGLSIAVLKNAAALSVPGATPVADYDEMFGKLNIGGIQDVLTKLTGMGYDLTDLIDLEMLSSLISL